MVVRIEVPCRSNWYPKRKPFTFVFREIDFELISDDKSNVYRIKAQKAINPNSEYLDECKKFFNGLGNHPWEFSTPLADKEIIDAIKFFENVICVEGELEINWDGINSHHIAESELERKLQADGLAIQSWGRIMHLPGKVDLEDPGAITCRLEYSEGLDIELSFYHHGYKSWQQKNYLQAFFNFYLILESYYSGGSHKHPERTFKKSVPLMATLNDLVKEPKFIKLIEGKIQEPSAEKIIDRLVRTRHKIFHFLDITAPEHRITYDEQERLREDISILNAIVWRCMRDRQRLLMDDQYKNSASKS